MLNGNFRSTSSSNLQIQKIFFVACLLVNIVGYFLYGIIPIMLRGTNSYPSDFYLVYMPCIREFILNPSDLYVSTCGGLPYHGLFRALPSLALYLLVFNSISSANTLNLFAQALSNVYLNLGSCYIIFRIANLANLQKFQIQSFVKSPYLIAGGYLLFPLHYFNYISGEVYSTTGFFALLGLYFFYTEKEHLGFFFWSLGLTFRINMILWIFFLILKKPFRNFVKNGCFAIFGQLPSIVMFLIWPKMIVDFIPSLISVSIDVITQDRFRVSGTLARELSFLFQTNILPFAIIIFVVLLPLVLIVINQPRFQFHDKLMIAVLATITMLPDSTVGHSLYYAPIYMLWLSLKSPDINMKIKLIPFIPTLSTLAWFLLPSVSLFYAVPLVVICVITMKKIPVRNILSRFLKASFKKDSQQE